MPPTALRDDRGVDADHAIDLLAREHDLLSADDSELLLQIAPLLARLEREAPIRDALADLDGDSDALVAEYRANEAASIQALLRSAEEWEARHPAVRGAANEARIELLKTPRRSDLPFDPRGTWTTPADRAISLLARAASELEQQGGKAWLDFIPASNRFREAAATHAYQRRRLQVRMEAEAPFALARLRQTARIVNPPPDRYTDESRYPVALALEGVIDRWVFGDRPTQTARADQTEVEKLARQARRDAGRLLAELGTRLGRTKSRLAVLRRFQTYAQWYARDELRAAVTEAQRGGKRGEVEKILTERLARFLFEHGLDPLWRPLLGRLEPDLLDPSTTGRLYVEAKQASGGAAVKRAATQGVRQAMDTASQLVGTSYRLDEAFVVIFVRDSPRVDVPAALRVASLTVRLLVIDLNDWTEVGSRRTDKPVVIVEEDLLHGIAGAPPADNGPNASR